MTTDGGVTTGTRGDRISAARKGKPLVARGPNEITRDQARKETGLSAKVLLAGADQQLQFERGESDRPGLRHRRQPNANGRGTAILFDRAELAEDLARFECSYPGCPSPAPGGSGRCGKHAARVKYPTVELVCDYDLCPREGKPFARAGSVHRGHSERGDEHVFCSDDCRFASQRTHDRLPPHAPFDADSARGRYEALGPLFEQERAELALPLTVADVAAAAATSPAVIRARYPEMGGQLLEVDGKEEIGLPEDAPQRYARVWAGRAHVTEEHWSRHRERYLDPDFMVRQQKRTISLLMKRGVSRSAAEAAVRASAEERRRKFIRRRTGRRATGDVPAHHTRWLESFLELRDYCERRASAGEAMPSDWSLQLIVAREDFAEHREDWTYDPDAASRSAAARVAKAIKPLLIARTKTRGR